LGLFVSYYEILQTLVWVSEKFF